VLNEEEESATVHVPDRQLSLAIGREGQNVRLAAKLTNWRIDIQGTTQVVEEETPEPGIVEVPQAEAVAAVATEAVPEAVETPAAEAPAEETAAAKTVEVPAAEVEAPAIEVETEPEEKSTSADVDAELLALEEELAALERAEQLRKDAEVAETLDVSSDDLWQVDGGDKSDSNSGRIRFAEDIAGFRETDAGRRGGRRGGSSARNRRR
jgi:N utilization substance protein A